MRDRAQHRIAWTLGVSALLHGWFILTDAQSGAPRATAAAAAPITATLNQPYIKSDRLAPQPALSGVPNLQGRVEKHTDNAVRSGAGESAPVTTARAAQPAVAEAMVVTLPTPPMPQPGTSGHDATYYTARDLDVFPKAITALDLGWRTGVAGKVRATVLIDESGAVNDVRALNSVGASVAEIESAARDLLLRARFTPASKDGRVVKAQLLVSLDYGSLLQ